MNVLATSLILGSVCGILIGYDAERWDRSVNGWSCVGLLFSVVAVIAWLVVRHNEAVHRRATGEPLPPPFRIWLRRRHRARAG